MTPGSFPIPDAAHGSLSNTHAHISGYHFDFVIGIILDSDVVSMEECVFADHTRIIIFSGVYIGSITAATTDSHKERSKLDMVLEAR
jgi:hypothetical protein